MPGIGTGVGAGIGALIGMFSKKPGSLSKEEQAIMAQLQGMATQQQGMATDLLAQSKAGGARYDQLARGVRSQPGMSQAMNYWSALLGGDSARMESAVAPSRRAVSKTYAGGRKQLERSNLRGPQKAKAQANMAQQEVGDLAALTQGVQPMAADKLGGMEAQVQQLMAQYLGLGEQARNTGAYSAATLMGGASSNLNTMLGVHGQSRQTNSAADAGFGAKLAPWLNAGAEAFGAARGGIKLNNRIPAGGGTGSQSGFGNWQLPKGTWDTTLPSKGYNYGNMTMPGAKGF